MRVIRTVQSMKQLLRFYDFMVSIINALAENFLKKKGINRFPNAGHGGAKAGLGVGAG